MDKYKKRRMLESSNQKKTASCPFWYFSECHPQIIYFRTSWGIARDLPEAGPEVCIQRPLQVSAMQTQVRRTISGHCTDEQMGSNPTSAT